MELEITAFAHSLVAGQPHLAPLAGLFSRISQQCLEMPYYADESAGQLLLPQPHPCSAEALHCESLLRVYPTQSRSSCEPSLCPATCYSELGQESSFKLRGFLELGAHSDTLRKRPCGGSMWLPVTIGSAPAASIRTGCGERWQEWLTVLLGGSNRKIIHTAAGEAWGSGR